MFASTVSKQHVVRLSSPRDNMARSANEEMRSIFEYAIYKRIIETLENAAFSRVFLYNVIR